MFTAVIRRPGGEPLELTPEADSVSFATAAQGGFGSCSFSVPLGDIPASRIPRLSHVALHHGPTLLWEGRVEDHDVDHVKRMLGLTCFGYRRLLDEISLRRIWILRAIGWQLVNQLDGTGLTFDPQTWAWSTVGRFDDTDLTRAGIKFSAQTNTSAAVNDAHGAWFYSEAPMRRILFQHTKIGSDPIAVAVYDSPDGVTWTLRYSASPLNTGPTEAEVDLAVDAKHVRMVAYFSSGVAGANVACEIEDIRILGATDSEDALGGLYPHTILRDLIAQVPGLEEGIIEDDTSFAIPQISRVQRDFAISVVNEVTGYYRRRWGVWEDRRLDWRSPSLDQAHWILRLSQLSECRIRTTTDASATDYFVVYQNAATALPEEQSEQSTDRRNDYVRAGQRKDELLSAQVGMTAVSAFRLAQRVAQDHGSVPSARGSVRLPASTLVDGVTGTPRPACHIRAGENVLIPELPKDEFAIEGRDGQTLFHVVSSETNMESEETKLELDGYTRSSEILMARLSAATRVLTG